jgi:predicted anti-sigma-YlaC factor YlaD
MNLECGEVRERLSEFIDGPELDDLCRAIEEHLAHCRDCRVEVDTLKRTIVLYQADHEMKIPVKVSAKLQAALTREYQRADSPD